MNATRKILGALTLAALLCGLLPSRPAEATTTQYYLLRVIVGGGQTNDTSPDYLPYAPRRYSTNYSVQATEDDDWDTQVHLDVKLPDDATVVKVRGYGYDNDANEYITVDLRRASYTSETTYSVASVTSSGGSSTWTSSTVSYAVDNELYNYWFTVTIPGGEGSSLRIWNVEVEYTVP